MCKKFIVIFFLTILSLFNSGSLKANDNIAFLNLNYIFDNSNAGKKFLKK